MLISNLRLTALSAGIAVLFSAHTAAAGNHGAGTCASGDDVLKTILNVYGNFPSGGPFSSNDYSEFNNFSALFQQSHRWHTHFHEGKLGIGSAEGLFGAAMAIFNPDFGAGSDETDELWSEFQIGGLEAAFGDKVDFSSGKASGSSERFCATTYEIKDGNHKGERLLVLTANGKGEDKKGTVKGLIVIGKDDEAEAVTAEALEALEDAEGVMAFPNGCGDDQPFGTIGGVLVGC